MSACESKFTLKDCGCVPHPIKDRGTICGYVDREYGDVVSCNPSCCTSKCSDDDLIPGIHVQISTGNGKLPDGFGNLIQTSETTTDTKGASEFVPVQQVQSRDQKVWEIMIIPVLLLVLVLIVA